MKRLVSFMVFGLVAFVARPSGQQPSPAYIAGEVLVKFHPAAPQGRRNASLALKNAHVQKHFDQLDIDHVKLADGESVESALAAFRGDVDVEAAQPNYIRHTTQVAPPSDPLWLDGTLWGIQRIQALPVWTSGMTGSASLVVADIDTGFNYNHPDLAPNAWTNPREIPNNGIDDDHDGYIDDVHGINVITHSGDPMDDNGHGTHTSGTMSAAGNNGIGVVGVNWNTKVLGCKFLDASGSGSDSGAIECFNYVVALKKAGVNIRVTSNSWGAPRSGSLSTAMQSAIDAAGAAGIVSVFAAGNSGTSNDAAPFDPASMPSASIISVAASDQSDNRAGWSNYGQSVHIAAPGVDIASTYGSGYAAMSGTSMATPHVAGAAGLLAAADPNLSVQSIKAALISGVDVLPQWAGLVSSGGRLNVANAMNAIGGSQPSQPAPPPPNVAPSVSVSSPKSGTSFSAGASVSLTASASDSDGTVSQVAFYVNSALVGTATQSPFTVALANVQTGSYSIVAQATDNLGLTSTSSAVPFTVLGPNVSPVIAITSPKNLTTETGTFTISASASDPDGTIASVSFYTNGVLIHSDTSGPYSTQWKNPPAGTYTLTAVAVDNRGGKTTSLPVVVVVKTARKK